MKEFETIGKRLPYSTPTDFFAGSRASILASALACETRNRRKHRIILRSSWASLAAAIAIVVGVVTINHSDIKSTSTTQALSSVSVDDVISTMSDDNLSKLNNTISYDYFIAQN